MAKSSRGNRSRKPSSDKEQRANTSSSAYTSKRRGARKRGKTSDSKMSGAPRAKEQYSSTASGAGSLNDLSWYARNPMLLAAVGSIPYPYRPGMSVPLSSDPAVPRMFIPTVMSLSWIPSFGTSTTTDSPASIAGYEIYGRVRAAYSGSLEADAPDYITYLGALDSIFMYISWLKRIYRTISLYSEENPSLPNSLLQAYGIPSASIPSLRNAKVSLWQGINELVLASRKWRCPAVMDIFNRHYWLSDHVYADAPSPRAQMYVFNPAAFFKIGQVPMPNSSDKVTGLQLATVNIIGAKPVDSLISFGWSLINALSEWDTALTISGYLTRAYDGVPSFYVAELEQGELQQVAYEPEVLMQIENARTALIQGVLINMSASQSTYYVSQDPTTNAVYAPNVISTVKDANFSVPSYVTGTLPSVNIHGDAPTVGDTVIATRLQTVVTKVDVQSNKTTTLLSLESGTEVLLEMNMFTSASNSVLVSSMAVYNFVSSLVPLTQFDWHPIVYIYDAEGSTSSEYPIVFGDIQNFTTMSLEQLKQINKICIYSEFNAFSL